MNLKKTVVVFLVVSIGCLFLVLETVEACQCLRDAERERRREESSCSLANDTGMIGCGLWGGAVAVGATPLGGLVVGAICAGVMVRVTYECNQQAEGEFHDNVASCVSWYAECG